jgi:hypothetical protein
MATQPRWFQKTTGGTANGSPISIRRKKMGRLKKVDPKFFTEEDLEAVEAGVEKWERICGEKKIEVNNDPCSLCDLKNKRVGEGCDVCVFGCVLAHSHGIADNCVSHFNKTWIHRSRYHSSTILNHLIDIRDQIKKGMGKQPANPVKEEG